MTDRLQIEDLAVQLGSKSVLKGFSLTLAEGEHVVVTARSGAGKSTLLRCILGFVMPERGRIAVDGAALDIHSVWSLRQRMAYVAQEPALGQGSVRAALERPFTYRANSLLSGNLDRVPKLMEMLRMSTDLLGLDLRDLSGGEKQRVALISALLLDRPILLLDEITASLDRESAAAVFATLAGLRHQTILAVGHHADALPQADRAVALDRAATSGAPS